MFISSNNYKKSNENLSTCCSSCYMWSC